MKIISHRGYWKKNGTKNSREAFLASFEIGCGVELDVRDEEGQLVISHGPSTAGALTFENFLGDYQKHGRKLPLAINIKADGLQNPIRTLTEQTGLTNYFLFDMSAPDTWGYLCAGLPVFARQSDYEPIPLFVEKAKGIWLDSFESDQWYSKELIMGHLQAGKWLCLASPELHQRDFQQVWGRLKNWKTCCQNSRFMLCTDNPVEANEHFGEWVHEN